jgi:hypothetical protein
MRFLAIGILLATAGWLLYPGDQPVRAEKVIPWHQPEAAFESFPLAIAPYLESQHVVRRGSTQQHPAHTWAFDFGALERQFARALATGKELIPDENLLRQFESAVQDLPSSLPSESVERIALLFEKSFPDTTGEQLAGLFGPMYHFHTEREAAAAHLAGRHPAGSLEQTRALLDSAEALQREHFNSEQVEQLFGRQNALSRYLLERRLVREDPRLSPEEKQIALRDLQNSFRVVK